MLFRFLFASLICSALPAWSAPAATSPAMMCRISDPPSTKRAGSPYRAEQHHLYAQR